MSTRAEHITLEGDTITTETLPVLELVQDVEEGYDPYNTGQHRILNLADARAREERRKRLPFTCQ